MALNDPGNGVQQFNSLATTIYSVFRTSDGLCPAVNLETVAGLLAAPCVISTSERVCRRAHGICARISRKLQRPVWQVYALASSSQTRRIPLLHLIPNAIPKSMSRSHNHPSSQLHQLRQADQSRSDPQDEAIAPSRAVLAEHRRGLLPEMYFRWRAGEITRLEAFCDVVFGFALTLLVVSLEVPRTYAELMAAIRGFVPFAACFAQLVLIWRGHYRFSRRYGLEDPYTVFLNVVLLFSGAVFCLSAKVCFHHAV